MTFCHVVNTLDEALIWGVYIDIPPSLRPCLAGRKVFSCLYLYAAVEIVSMRRSKPESPTTFRKAKPDHKSVIQQTIVTIIDNLDIDLCFLNELKRRRVINDHILVDVLSRPNRLEKVRCMSEHLLALGPLSLVHNAAAMVKCGYEGLAGVLQHLMIEERDRAWSNKSAYIRSNSTVGHFRL